LSFEKELVCAPCRHAKMLASSHPLLTDVMIEHPCELLHMDLVGPARVRSMGGKWYVLVVVDDYSRYAWVFFLKEKGEMFCFVRDLVLRLRNMRHGDAIRAIRGDNGSEFKNSHFETFCHDLGLEHQFSSPYTPP
jgi:transposase InsO family protein